MTEAPLISVVIPTYNRAERIPTALATVLAQHGVAFEVLVVDDGSTDETAAAVASVDDERVRYAHRVNGGISAARNTGAASARGAYVVFLDDDDRPRPGWLAALARTIDATGAAVVFFGARFVDPDGDAVGELHPRPLGPAFEDAVGVLGQSPCVRADVFATVGGYAEGLQCSHTTELALRLLPACREHGWRLESVDEPLVDIERRAAGDRPESTPAKLAQGAGYVLRQHGARLSADPSLLADFHGVAGVAAARLGRYGQARRELWAATLTRPRPRQIARLALACVPPAGRRVWGVDREAERA